MTKTEEKLYTQISREMAGGHYDRAALTKACADAGGERLKLQGCYIKARFKQLEVTGGVSVRWWVTAALCVLGFGFAYVPGLWVETLGVLGAVCR